MNYNGYRKIDKIVINETLIPLEKIEKDSIIEFLKTVKLEDLKLITQFNSTDNGNELLFEFKLNIQTDKKDISYNELFGLI